MERMAFRAQTVIADVAIAATAFAIAYLAAPLTLSNTGLAGLETLNLAQLTLIYAAAAGVFTAIFRRELSPWRYASVPDALVLARIALLTVGVFLLSVFVLDRARGLPRSILFMAPVLQLVGCTGGRILRRAMHEHALNAFAPLKSIAERDGQTPSLLLIGRPSLADTYLRDAARNHDRSFAPVGIISTDPRDVGQQVRGVCVLESLENLQEALADLEPLSARDPLPRGAEPPEGPVRRQARPAAQRRHPPPAPAVDRRPG
jgi:O-antigen biosynthesis protein WbqV